MIRILIIINLVFCSGLILGQNNSKKNDLTCFCSARETPNSVVNYDNNLQLLKSFSDGRSKKELDSLHIPYTESQLKLLRMFDLIRKDKDKYYTNIPILDESQTIHLRTQSKLIADKITPLAVPDIKELVSYLNSINRSKNAFSIMFSYVIDGLTWRIFEEKGIIKPFITIDNTSQWTGHFWILDSRRDTKYGTNTSGDSAFSISVTNGASYKIMKAFYEDDNSLELIANDIKLNGKVTDKRVIDALSKFGLFNEQGNITIPIINENNQDRLYTLSRLISSKICEITVLNASIEDVVKEYHFKNNEQALVILYHEIMWDLLDNLIAQNIVEKPLILSEPDKAEMKDLSDLIFITRNK